MKENVQIEKTVTPMLFPFDPDQYWQRIRLIIREEVTNVEKSKPAQPLYETPGMTYKPLLKLVEVCDLFQVTKPTIYDWIRHGKLKRCKIRSRVFFLWNDIQELLKTEEGRKD
ncbi:DNA binding domain-containing protein, excisionase family [Chitinophaga eiseniae]|uniref:DNA binding domain-containing protein, excisionase family n=1 Tax=Chitinophaga eiseniae TaxID=634771 RepID=A0A1T4NWS8_9BACT|nr:helix-turn-helix domain-containing protein [Chitinophaga eiseniae]SJZ83517.1 DNA binding domain-containing protein, excisionase family [Chitinophaga eiseniae]